MKCHNFIDKSLNLPRFAGDPPELDVAPLWAGRKAESGRKQDDVNSKFYEDRQADNTD